MSTRDFFHWNRKHTPHYKGEPHGARTIIAGTIGNVMEWYNFSLFGFFSPIIADLFFPSNEHLTSLIATFGVFAAGFFMRPLGGGIFGVIGDHYGRQVVLRVSIITMGVATTLLGLLPTSGAIGLWSPVLLVFVVLLQGLSVGGEFSGSVTYMVETSPLDRRGFSGSWANIGSLMGTLMGSGFAAGMTTFLPPDQLHRWGWRVPFLVGGLLGFFAYGYVKTLGVTPHMEHHEAVHGKDNPLREVLTRNRRETMLAIVFACGYGVFYYLPMVYLPTYASQQGIVSHGQALQINTLGLAISMPLIPIFGWISDHLLRRRSLLMLGFGSIAVWGWALLFLANQSIWGLLAAQILLAIMVSVALGAAPAMMVELFPVDDRLTGYSLAYNVGLAVAGGTSPVVVTWLISSTGIASIAGVYLALASLVSVLALWLMRDRSREPLR